MFRDRTDAGKKLASKLAAYRDKDVVVLGLPRGGVVVAYEVAKALNLPLDIVAVRKIGHPTNPEYAIGVVDERGSTIFNSKEIASVSERWLKEETARQRAEAARRSRLYRDHKAAYDLAGKTAIIVDDGIATGFTMRLAVRSAKEQGAKKIVVAVPVAPPDALSLLKDEGADEIVILEPPEEFMGAVGAHYVRFEQTSDEDVIRFMRAI